MLVSKSVTTVRSTLLSVVLLAMLSTASFAQNAAPENVSNNPPLTPLPQAPAPQHNAHLYSDQDYSRGKRQWPNPFVVYTVRDVAPLNVANSGRTDSLLVDGKLYLSLDDAVAMALEDNLDIGIQRYNLSIADTDVLRTSSGAVALGVNAGLLQGTPGGQTGTTSAGGTGTSTTGSTGGGVGGTTIGVGGAGAGVGGIVASTQGEGPPIDNFDPVLTGTVEENHVITPEANTVFTGTPSLSQTITTANFAYTQGFSTGTLMTVGFDNTRTSSNALYNTLNPNLTPNFSFELRQHLLSGFGFDPNLRWIRIARNNKEIEDVTFRLQVITTVSQIENIYWDLVNAYSNVTVQQRALDLANKTLSDDQKEVAAGTLAPLTVVQAQSAVATAQQNIVAARVNLELEQLLMKNAITRNMADPILAVAPVIPTDTLNIKEQYQIPPVEDLIHEALQQRPEIATARLTLTNTEISRKSIRNQLLPTVDLFAFYGASGLAGTAESLMYESHSGLLACRIDSYHRLRRCIPESVQQLRAEQGCGCEHQHPAAQSPDPGRSSAISVGISPGADEFAANRKHDSAASAAGAIYVGTELCGLPGCGFGPRLCRAKPGRRAKEAAHGSFHHHPGVAGFERLDPGRVQCSRRCHQLREVESAARFIHG